MRQFNCQIVRAFSLFKEESLYTERQTFGNFDSAGVNTAEDATMALVHLPSRPLGSFSLLQHAVLH